VQEPAPVSRFIHAVPESLADVAVPALAKEVARLIRKAVAHNSATLDLFSNYSEADAEELQHLYHTIKRLDGQILQYSHSVQTGSLSVAESAAIDYLLRATRDATFASKSIKDIRHNLLEFDRHGNLAVIDLLQERLKLQSHALEHLNQLTSELSPDSFTSEEAERLMLLAQKNHDQFESNQQQGLAVREIDDYQASTLLNINRELYTAMKNLLNAVILLHEAVMSLTEGGMPVTLETDQATT
jgi:Na+/phosphate symporter